MRVRDADPIRQYDMGEAGVGRVREALGDGQALGTRLIAEVGVGAGRTFTFAPALVDRARLLRWDEGGMVTGEVGLRLVADYVRRLLEVPSSLFIAERLMARPSDPGVRAGEAGTFFVDDEVYEYVGPYGTGAEVESCLRGGFRLLVERGRGIGRTSASLDRGPGLLRRAGRPVHRHPGCTTARASWCGAPVPETPTDRTVDGLLSRLRVGPARSGSAGLGCKWMAERTPGGFEPLGLHDGRGGSTCRC